MDAVLRSEEQSETELQEAGLALCGRGCPKPRPYTQNSIQVGLGALVPCSTWPILKIQKEVYTIPSLATSLKPSPVELGSGFSDAHRRIVCLIPYICPCIHQSTTDTARTCVHELFRFVTFRAKFVLRGFALQQIGDCDCLWVWLDSWAGAQESMLAARLQQY